MSQLTDTSEARTVYDKTLSLKNGRVKINYTVSVDADGRVDGNSQMTIDGQEVDTVWGPNDSIPGIGFAGDVEIDGQQVGGVQLDNYSERTEYEQTRAEFGGVVQAYEAVDDLDALDLDEGERTLVKETTTGCDDHNKECNTDKVQYYLCADGSVETERVHLH